MLSNQPNRQSHVIWVSLAGISVGAVAGFTAGANPIYLLLAVVAVPIVVYFFTNFEQAVLNLLAVRTCLDPFSGKQIPAAYGLGMDALTLLYVTVTLMRGRRIRTDGFWWFFAGWVLLQGLWVILLPLEGVGLNADYLPGSIREWIRLFTWVMVYLLVMQLKDRVPPKKAIAWLFLSLVIPVTVALMQMFVPSHLPSFLNEGGAVGAMPVSEISRIKGTMGHPNAFATTLLLFISLTYWKLTNSKQKLPWFLIMGLLALCFVSTKALTGLTMLAAFVLVLVVPRLNFLKLIGGVLFFAVIIGLFANSEFGRERLGSLSNTPLFNPDIDTSRAILLSQGDNNSFNWRLAQWTYLMSKIFPLSPFLGFGLGLSIEAGGNGYLPHNDYIRALIEGGMTGFATYIGFFVAQGIRLIQLIRAAPPKSPQRNLCVILLAVMFAMLTGMLSDNIWSHTILFSYWFAVLAIAGWNWNDPPSSLGRSELQVTGKKEQQRSLSLHLGGVAPVEKNGFGE